MKGMDKEDRAEIARGKKVTRGEEARETAKSLVGKSMSGKGTLTYTPKKKGK
jgi:hypothetical protein